MLERLTRCLFLSACITGAGPAAAMVTSPVDAELLQHCAARTDARMESMTLGKLDQIRNYEFSLRMALAQLSAGSDAMSASEWQRASARLRTARMQLAQACDLPLPAQG